MVTDDLLGMAIVLIVMLVFYAQDIAVWVRRFIDA